MLGENTLKGIKSCLLEEKEIFHIKAEVLE